MTDAEKELRRLAKGVPAKSHMDMPEVMAYLRATVPSVVLGLLDRIENFEHVASEMEKNRIENIRIASERENRLLERIKALEKQVEARTIFVAGDVEWAQ